MRGNERVISTLNEALREELTAINQYFIHAEMCERWGYRRLGHVMRRHSIDEMKHGEGLIERLLFLEAVPAMDPLPLTIGRDIRLQMQNDLDLEFKSVVIYNTAIAAASDADDTTSRDLFERLLGDEESHVDFLEAQLHQIREIGYERYLAEQLDR